ncbi:MAG: outer membrane beta-barrel protein [Candidatus Aminicenantes bacterium]|nr:outer membrane beta-barrel protein [Candidatus Aminicenantes bacterium]
MDHYAILRNMYRKLSVVLFLFIFARTIQAGEVKALVGMNSSKYLFTAAASSLNSQQKTGVRFGLGWAFNLVPKIKLELNALYSQGGAKASIAFAPNQSLSGFYRNTSLALPIFLKYQFKTKATPYIALGPEFVFLLSHHFLLPDGENDYNLSDSTKKFILAVTAMLGYELPFGEWSLTVEIRYSRWLNNFLIDPETEARSESFALLLGGAYHL